MAPRYLYLVRHGEADASGTALTAAGRRQAALLGARLRDVPLTRAVHSPVGRAAETARVIVDGRGDVVLEQADEAGDFVPYVPARDELPASSAERHLRFLDGVDEPERRRGAELAAAARAAFTGPVAGSAPARELVVTHAYLVGWLVADALGAPPWRWLTINAGNAALTVIRYAPASLLVYNDTGHLPPGLRWTGFPPPLTV